MGIYETRALKARPEVLESMMTVRGMPYHTTNKGTMLLYREVAREPAAAAITRTILDHEKGHMVMFPSAALAAGVTPKLVTEPIALKTAQEFVARHTLIPQDASQVTSHKMVTRSKMELSPNRQAKTTEVMQTVLFQRTLDARPMLGKGSQLSINLGHAGQVLGLNRTWNQVVKSPLAPEYNSATEVYDAIERMLKDRFQGARLVTVKKPHLVYYGDDAKYVVPAYFFTAVISTPGVAQKAFFSGVVPAVKNAPERLMPPRPQIETPGVARELRQNARTRANFTLPPGDPTVGRYVVREDSHDWVDDANEFKAGLIAGHPGSFPPITFGDYYWDQPFCWTTSANSFANKWNVALMEGHGNTWLFTTRQNAYDIVNLNAGSQPGYGQLGGSSMRFLILKGCAIIPGPPDRSDWDAPWWRIFKGLRQAVGFRTEMYIDDDISGQFGHWLAQNCQVIDSLFCAADNCSSYQWERFWGSWGDEIYGYGCAVTIPGAEHDGIYSIGAAPPATSVGLNIWWEH